MTVLSTKKSTNNTRDSTTNQQPAQIQQQQQTSNTQQQSIPTTLTRTRVSHDDEHSIHSHSHLDSNDDSDDANDQSSSPSSLSPTTTNDFQSMLTTTATTTTASIFSNQSKRKSNYHHQHHHTHSTINKQARRKCQNHGDNTTSDNEQYNSEDEYEQRSIKYDRNNLDEYEMRFARALKEKKGFVIKPVQEDGACLFRAVSDQVFGDEEMHSTVRQNCMDYIVKNADYFRPYITEDFDQYVTRKRLQNCHGNHIEMIALSEIYNRPIEVYEYSTEPINTVHGMYKTDNEPIRLSYHCGVHYNSIVDPWRPTAGHGLGLPDLEPGQAQNSLMNTALKESEESHIEKTMLDDKLAATDWEATQDEIMEQIARESYLQWLHETTNSSNATTLNACSNQTASDNNQASSSNNLLPLRLDERKDCEFSLPFHYECDTASTSELVDDDSLMRQVLVMSQIEYVENLKKQQASSSECDEPNASSSSTTEHSHF